MSRFTGKAPIERISWFDIQVKKRGYPNAKRLAEKFEISSRTAQRDIEFIRDRLGAPLSFNNDRKGYEYTNVSYCLPSLWLDSSQIASLLIARKALQSISSGHLEKSISGIIDKIESLVISASKELRKIDELFLFNLRKTEPPPENIFKMSVDAIINSSALSITYHAASTKKITERIIDPYRLLNYYGSWYLIGYCHLRKAIRDFALHRIKNISFTEKTCSHPEEKEIDRYIQQGFGIFKGGKEKIVKIKFSPKQAFWIAEQTWHKKQKIEKSDDGSLLLSFPVLDFTEAAMEILKYGGEAEALAPPEFVKLIKEKIKEMQKNYHL